MRWHLHFENFTTCSDFDSIPSFVLIACLHSICYLLIEADVWFPEGEKLSSTLRCAKVRWHLHFENFTASSAFLFIPSFFLIACWHFRHASINDNCETWTKSEHNLQSSRYSKFKLFAPWIKKCFDFQFCAGCSFSDLLGISRGVRGMQRLLLLGCGEAAGGAGAGRPRAGLLCCRGYLQ